MNRKQKIIVSTVVIFLVLLILVGLTYAYFLTRIKGNENEKSISVTTANLILEYADIDDIVVGGENVEPGTTWTKKFSATNKGNKKVEYGVALENVLNTLERTEDLVYTLNCTSSLGTTCNKVETETEFPIMGKILVTNSIEDDKVQVYTLVVTYKDTGTDQSIDMNKQFSAKANLVNPSTFGPMGSGTLATAIIENAKKASEESDATKTKFGTRVTEFTSISGDDERVLNNAPDDYGMSYYYRGNVNDNYVSFADKTWRIVRINGDGTVRLVLDDVARDSDGNIIETAFNENADDNAYVGYMYGMTGQTEENVNQCIKLSSDGTTAQVDTTNTTEETCVQAGGKWAPTPYDATHVNVVSSNIKTTLENWYKTNIVDTNNSSYVADTLFCNDKTIAPSTIGSDNTALGYGNNATHYSFTKRLRYSTGTTEIITSKPTFECVKDTNNMYSRYTVNETTLLNGNKTNGDLTYPIGLLTADEVAYAGAYKLGQTNKTYYLYNALELWWLMTPVFVSNNFAVESMVNSDGILGSAIVKLSSPYADLFPVLNLKKDLLVINGNGTKENPYQIK